MYGIEEFKGNITAQYGTKGFKGEHYGCILLRRLRGTSQLYGTRGFKGEHHGSILLRSLSGTSQQYGTERFKREHHSSMVPKALREPQIRENFREIE